MHLGLVLLLIFSWNCQRQGVRNGDPSLQPAGLPRESTLTLELHRTAEFLDMVETWSEGVDSQEIELRFQKTLSLLDSLAGLFPEDSEVVTLQSRAAALFDSYRAQMLAPVRDSLSAEAAMQDLDDILGSDSLSLGLSGPGQPADGKSIPIISNSTVEKAIRYFSQGRGRKIFARWLERAGSYEKLVKDILAEEGAPQELFYLAMIESGLNPAARSYARAVGMWQFIYSTGRAYGLQQSWWYDDRRDPTKATRAAARHLLDLYERFGDWYLGIAGYNFSPKKIEKRLARYNVSEFWKLPRLPRQTRNYVPTFLAAVTIARDPQKYGFEAPVSNPIRFDTVTVRECVDLNVVAQCVGSSFEEMKKLNPALLRWCTPPDVESWVLNLPLNTRETFLARYSEIPKEQKTSWVRHQVRSGETLSTIAARYRVSLAEVRRFNNIRGSLIRAGQNLVIPVPQNKDYYRKYVASQQTAASTRSARRQPVANVAGREKLVYNVRKGDTLWDVARRFNVTLTQLRDWNGLGYSRIIKPGQSLNIWLKPGSEVSGLLAQNSAPTATAAVEKPASTEGGEFITHVVRSGDTLWDIAQAYNVSISDLKKWNGKRKNTIHPGEELQIRQ